MPRQRIHVEIEGLIAVHAVRAVRTALAAVPGIEQADVSMQGAVLETSAPVSEAALREALGLAGVALRSMRIERGGLPLL
ncbi:MAG: heavy-metal-associated domain-containing protein [Gemmatimonadaceae bacterium]|nr:heavy-metal-associated domain-containing protein [Gemmatimonadaceae bacterium]